MSEKLPPLRVGMVGLGVVGSGCVSTLIENQTEIMRRSGKAIVIDKVAVRDPAKLRSVNLPREKIVSDWRTIVDDPTIDVVVELIGGETIAREVVLAAINAGKHLVTANKALLARYGNEIFAKAREKEVIVAFEAAVAGGIPVIKALREGLSGNHLTEVIGIINGTCNYILSAMFEKGREFAEVLAEAQNLGYAEADPCFDIDGIDTKHKIAILAALAFGQKVDLDQVFVEGIRHLTLKDIEYTQKIGYRIKLLGIARKSARGTEIRVHPTLIPAKTLIANVEGVMNAVQVRGDRVGKTLFCGPGAGANPTASAVVADLVDIARLNTADPAHHVPYLAFQYSDLHDEAILPIAQTTSGYYLRLRTHDQTGALAEITRILADQQISIDSILQYPNTHEKATVDVIILTHRVEEGLMQKALAKISALSVVGESPMLIRRDELSD